MFNALSFNYYYGNKEQSKVFWEKLLQISKVDVGYAPGYLKRVNKHLIKNITTVIR